jgi:tripartite ATP-independent transporter DctM subunit
MPLPEILAIAMVAAVCVLLFVGYPVALTLGGVSLGFAFLGHALGAMDIGLMYALPQRMFGVMTNTVLIAIPLFIFMGVMLERSRIAEDLLETMGRLFGALPGGLGIAVVLVGVLLAAAKGVVGATVVTIALITLPTMLRHGYDKRLAAGTVAATATLAQIMPPATVLVLLGDQLNNSFQAAQLAKGIFAPESISVSDLFAGAIVPALTLVLLYLLLLVAVAIVSPKSVPPIPPDPAAPHGAALVMQVARAMVAPVLLIVVVLGSILIGLASPTESAAVGAVGAILLAALRAKSLKEMAAFLQATVNKTAQMTSMIFTILIGATLFSLVFRGLGGDDMVHRSLDGLPGGVNGAILVVMLAMFLLGFVMDAFEIIFVVVPIVAVPLLKLHGIDPIWLGVMMAMNLQTSYMHPPLGPTLFFLRGVAPPEITTRHIYLGIIPFVAIQLFALVVLWYLPGLATALPHALYSR